MKNLRYFVFCLLLIMPIFQSCQKNNQTAKLTADLITEVNFKIDDFSFNENVENAIFSANAGDSFFNAKFYSFSDKSLYFVKVSGLSGFAELAENKSIANEMLINAKNPLTLTRAISASGERYIDETGGIEFWLKGDSATLRFTDLAENNTILQINLSVLK